MRLFFIKILTILSVLSIVSLYIVQLVTAQPPPPPTPGIIGTKHNLSVTGPGFIKSTTESRICVFCHTPHNARRDITYLWNRKDSTANYMPYQSSTLYSLPGQPTGSSKLCLSCHDGTIALGALLTAPEIPFAGGIRFIPEGRSRIGTDLSDDHPISFAYNNALATANGELALPGTLPSRVRLDENQQLQCRTCHDPHDNTFGKFLVMQNSISALCNTCHIKTGWDLSSHKDSNATWNYTGPDPWPNSDYLTVSDNSCQNCHSSHMAGGPERIMNYYFEEDNCILCHNGNVAATDIESEMIKTYGHPVQNYTGIHDPTEDFTATVTDHVECVDCHEPHQAKSDPTPQAPQISRVSEGISGIDLSGQNVAVAAYQYEICFKCHADNNVISTVQIDRQIQQLNTRLEFDSTNPSYHPVEFQGANTNVPSLLPPLTENSVIYCTDCHYSDDANAPHGPHGSNNTYLLGKNYTTQDVTIENFTNYELCYKCHSRASILNNESFTEHSKHIVEKNTPCSACHDAHGISSTQGNAINNSHLINFDIIIVQPDSLSRLQFEDTGTFSGRCYLNCHGKEHSPETYP